MGGLRERISKAAILNVYNYFNGKVLLIYLLTQTNISSG